MITPPESLPSGTVTFLFTDIEGSTNLAQQYPEALPVLLARHNAIMQHAIESNQGTVFRMAGDAFCAAFPTSRAGLSAALTAQRELQREAWAPAPVWVRMGLHTGEARARAQGSEMDPYVGYLTLTRVQRVMSVAHGGQVLLSNAIASLARGELPPDVSLRDMGAHKLKGLPEPEPLWQLVAPDLRGDFAPLQSLDAAPGNLPTPLNRLVGRARERNEVKQLLQQARLVTLLGPGGTGKTRLALQVAADLTKEFEGRVYFLDLAASRDSAAVLAVLARTTGLREKSDSPLLQELKVHLANKKMLCLMDNFEQVISAASVIAELLRDCPGLKILVTSREALHIRGEQVYPLPPLTLPRVDAKRLNVAQLAQSEAVQLFMERARAVQPGLELTEENAQAITEICLRLDGLPLAIELATARLNVLTPQALAERLGNRLKLLRGGAQDLPERHQTLRNTIDWSYETLEPGEKALFKALAVFDGANLTAIEAVSSRLDELRQPDVDVFEGVSSLVDKSLLRQVREPAGESRLRMFETIREYAMAQLEEDTAFCLAARRAHANFFADLTHAQLDELRGREPARAMQRLVLDLENIRTAWRYWAAEGNLEQLGKFTDALWLLYDAEGWYHGTVELTTDLLRVLGTTVSTPERARQEIILQTGLARALLATKGYTTEVEQAYARALELCQSAGEIPQIYPAMRGLAAFYLLRGEFSRALEIGRQMLELGERLDDNEMRIGGHLVIGENLASTDDLAGALEHIEQTIAAYQPHEGGTQQRALGSNPGVVSRMIAALVLWMTGFPEQARKRMAEGIQFARQLDHPFSLAYAEYHCAFLMTWLRDYPGALEHARIVMELAEEHDFQLWYAAGECVRGAAIVELGPDDEGLALIAQGVAAYRGPKSPPVFLTLLLLLYARAYQTAGRPAEAAPLLREAIEIGQRGEGKTMISEFMTANAELILALDPENAVEAEGWFQNAVASAREVGATMLELRAALPLSRFWHARGKTGHARALLSGIYARFTEGFDLPDLVDAKTLLEELS